MNPIVGVGLDLVDVGRFTTMLRRRPRILTRLFSDREIDDAGGRPERLAARFAAKEATWKVLGVGLGTVRFRDVEVQRDANGAPRLHLSNAAAERSDALDVASWHLSLSHSELSAGAVVIGSRS
jgi:holo-[acyl-carrier protein] synthase